MSVSGVACRGGGGGGIAALSVGLGRGVEMVTFETKN